MAQNASDETVVIARLQKAWTPALTLWQQYIATTGGRTPDSPQSRSAMNSVADQVNHAYDDLVDVLGKSFAKGDDAFQTDISDLETGTLSQLCVSLGGPSTSSNRRSDSSNINKAESEKLAASAIARTIQILDLLASRLGYNKSRGQSSSPGQVSLFDDTDDVDWCKGALLNQQSSANFESTIAQPFGTQSKVCKFCYLEISDYRSKAVRHTNEDWSALASCHVLAYASFSDRRAAYRCFGCDVKGISKIQASAAAMSDHVSSCPEFIERRARSQLPPRSHGRPTRAQPSPPPTSRANNSVPPVPSMPPKAHGYSTAPRPDPYQYEDRLAPTSNPPPTRSAPSVPPPPRARPALATRPDMDSPTQRLPGGYPAPQPAEPINPYQIPQNIPTPGSQALPQTPQRNVPLHRKAVIPIEPSLTPQYPPMNSPQAKRPNPATYQPDTSPASPRVPPPQVRQLMELGASRGEAESRLHESNWDVQEAAELYLSHSMSRMP